MKLDSGKQIGIPTTSSRRRAGRTWRRRRRLDRAGGGKGVLGDGVVATGAGVVAGPVGAAPWRSAAPTVVAAGSPVSSRRIPT